MIFGNRCGIIIKLFLGVAQLVARYLGVVEAGCSSHLTQTRGKPLNDKVERFSFLCIAKRLPPKPPAAAPGCLVFPGCRLGEKAQSKGPQPFGWGPLCIMLLVSGRWIQVDADTHLAEAGAGGIAADHDRDPEPVSGKGLLQGPLDCRAVFGGLGGKAQGGLLPGGGDHTGHPAFQL